MKDWTTPQPRKVHIRGTLQEAAGLPCLLEGDRGKPQQDTCHSGDGTPKQHVWSAAPNKAACGNEPFHRQIGGEEPAFFQGGEGIQSILVDGEATTGLPQAQIIPGAPESAGKSFPWHPAPALHCSSRSGRERGPYGGMLPGWERRTVPGVVHLSSSGGGQKAALHQAKENGVCHHHGLPQVEALLHHPPYHHPDILPATRHLQKSRGHRAHQQVGGRDRSVHTLLHLPEHHQVIGSCRFHC